MASRTISKIHTQTAANVDAADILSAPFNVINERLERAHATLDLIYTLAVQTDRVQEMIESLCAGTLITAINSAMHDIEAAREAANSEVAHG